MIQLHVKVMNYLIHVNELEITTRCVIITGTPNFQGQNLVNMRLICTKLSGPRHAIMLHELLPELSCTAFTV